MPLATPYTEIIALINLFKVDEEDRLLTADFIRVIDRLWIIDSMKKIKAQLKKK